ncbi:MAG: zinc-ribbon domain-containing protein [Rhodospirillales bacterium]|nr:zinc-ribbon domain-containing protein [Rhodospirillales bacterium]
MIVTCPSCKSRFRIADDALGDKGRQLRCSRCQYSWFESLELPPAVPSPEGFAAQQPPAVSPPPSTHHAPPVTPPPLRPEPTRTAPNPPQLSRPPLQAPLRPLSRDLLPEGSGDTGTRDTGAWRRAAGWILLTVVLAAVLAGGWFFRDRVVAVIPESARIYQFLGLDLQSGRADGLEIRDLAFREEQREEQLGGNPMLAVSGAVFNSSTSTRPVPGLEARLLDSEGREAMRWRFRIPVLSLPPGGSQVFEERHPAPDGQGPFTIQVEIRTPQG